MSTVMKTTRDVKGIGISILRPDAPDKVTGQVQYVADLNLRGLLHAKLLRSPHAHAKIVRIDVSRARALPGVRAVLTAADIILRNADQQVRLMSDIADLSRGVTGKLVLEPGLVDVRGALEQAVDAVR